MSKSRKPAHETSGNDGCGGPFTLNYNEDPAEDFGDYGDAYWEAGQCLAQRLISSPIYCDAEACPIIFLYRHALELYLKAIILVGEPLLKECGQPLDVQKLFRNHHLSDLLPLVNKVWTQVGWSWDVGLENYKKVTALVRQMEKLDPDSYAFRYPSKKNLQPSLDRHFVYSVEFFTKQFDPLLRMLSGASIGISKFLEQRALEEVDEEP